MCILRCLFHEMLMNEVELPGVAHPQRRWVCFSGAAGVAHPKHVACHAMSEVVLQVSCSRCCVMLLHD